MREAIFSVSAWFSTKMIAGCLPFSGATISDVIASILKSEPKPLSGSVRNVPPELEWSVAKALNKDRDERYQTIKGLLSDLKRLRQRLDFELELKRAGNSNLISTEKQATLILPPPARHTRKTRKAIDSLAVLPLVNDTGDSNTEYLSDGITECIINSLSMLPKLRVVPRSTVFRYKENQSDLQEVGNELGVRVIFSGRVAYWRFDNRKNRAG